MGIANLGESLLGDIRKRNEEQAKRQEKIARNTALGKLAVKGGLAIGNKLLEEQANNFFQNEQMLAATATQNKAMTNAQQLMSIQKQAEAQGMSVKDYKFSQVRPVFEARLKENYKARIGVNEAGEAPGFDALVTQEAMKYVDEWNKDYLEALSLANEIGTQQDFNKMLQLNAKKVVSSDVGSWVTKNFTRMFSGKSSDDIQREAVLAIADSDMAQNAEKLNIFMEEYSRTNNVNEAKNFADSVIFDEMTEGTPKTSTEVKLQQVNGQLVAVTVQTETNPITGVTNESIVRNEDNKPDVTVLNKASPEESSLKIAQGLMSTYNYGKDANKLLTTAAYKKFIREAKAQNLNITAPQTPEEYFAITKIFNTIATQKQSLKNPALEKRVLSIAETLAQAGIETKALMNSFESDPEKREQGFIELGTMLNNLHKQVTGILSEDEEDENSIDYRETVGE